jgi:hypothetical protein
MVRLLIGAGMAIALCGGSEDHRGTPQDPRQAVLVELFTSEGCSSCPPADALLEHLDQTQPVAGAQIIVLSEHVDYWNHIGWSDPYSSPAFSARQELYAHRFRLNGPYTPQMVVDGRSELVGSDARGAESAIRVALQQPKVSIRIEGESDLATVEVDPLPPGTAHTANVYLASAADDGTSDVLRGENKGWRLHHVSIAKDLKQAGTVDHRSGFRTQIPVVMGSRLIVFVQESGNGPVWGAAVHAAKR